MNKQTKTMKKKLNPDEPSLNRPANLADHSLLYLFLRNNISNRIIQIRTKASIHAYRTYHAAYDACLRPGGEPTHASYGRPPTMRAPPAAMFDPH